MMSSRQERKRKKRERKGFWFDVADFFILLGEVIYYLIRAIFRVFD